MPQATLEQYATDDAGDETPALRDHADRYRRARTRPVPLIVYLIGTGAGPQDQRLPCTEYNRERARRRELLEYDRGLLPDHLEPVAPAVR